MAELEVTVPLAQFDTDEWAEFSDFQSSQDQNCNTNTNTNMQTNTSSLTPDKNDNNDILDNMSDTTETFKDSFSASLEDLVNTFDEKITKCFCNYEDQVEKYAPVQVRTQEEIMNECQYVLLLLLLLFFDFYTLITILLLPSLSLTSYLHNCLLCILHCFPIYYMFLSLILKVVLEIS